MSIKYFIDIYNKKWNFLNILLKTNLFIFNKIRKRLLMEGKEK